MDIFSFCSLIAGRLNKERHNTHLLETLTAEARQKGWFKPEKSGVDYLSSRSIDPFSVMALMFTTPFGRTITYNSACVRMAAILPYLGMSENDIPTEHEWDKAAKVSREQRKFYNHHDDAGELVPVTYWWDLLECAVALADGQKEAEKPFADLYARFKNKNGFPQCLNWVAPHFFLSLENTEMRSIFSRNKSVRHDMSAEKYLEFCRYWQKQVNARQISLGELQAQERLRIRQARKDNAKS